MPSINLNVSSEKSPRGVEVTIEENGDGKLSSQEKKELAQALATAQQDSAEKITLDDKGLLIQDQNQNTYQLDNDNVTADTSASKDRFVKPTAWSVAISSGFGPLQQGGGIAGYINPEKWTFNLFKKPVSGSLGISLDLSPLSKTTDGVESKGVMALAAVTGAASMLLNDKSAEKVQVRAEAYFKGGAVLAGGEVVTNITDIVPTAKAGGAGGALGFDVAVTGTKSGFGFNVGVEASIKQEVRISSDTSKNNGSISPFASLTFGRSIGAVSTPGFEVVQAGQDISVNAPAGGWKAGQKIVLSGPQGSDNPSVITLEVGKDIEVPRDANAPLAIPGDKTKDLAAGTYSVSVQGEDGKVIPGTAKEVTITAAAATPAAPSVEAGQAVTFKVPAGINPKDIASIEIDGKPLAANEYSVKDGVVTINAGVLTEGEHTIALKDKNGKTLGEQKIVVKPAVVKDGALDENGGLTLKEAQAGDKIILTDEQGNVVKEITVPADQAGKPFAITADDLKDVPEGNITFDIQRNGKSIAPKLKIKVSKPKTTQNGAEVSSGARGLFEFTLEPKGARTSTTTTTNGVATVTQNDIPVGSFQPTPLGVVDVATWSKDKSFTITLISNDPAKPNDLGKVIYETPADAKIPVPSSGTATITIPGNDAKIVDGKYRVLIQLYEKSVKVDPTKADSKLKGGTKIDHVKSTNSVEVGPGVPPTLSVNPSVTTSKSVKQYEVTVTAAGGSFLATDTYVLIRKNAKTGAQLGITTAKVIGTAGTTFKFNTTESVATIVSDVIEVKVYRGTAEFASVKFNEKPVVKPTKKKVTTTTTTPATVIKKPAGSN